MPRLLALALTTALLPLAPTAAAAAEPDEAVVVTAVVREADGGLAFVERTAGSETLGERLAERLEDAPGVVAADVANPVRLLSTDQLRGEQWGLTRLRAESLWPDGDGTGVVVAVVDTGVDGTHPDLVGKVRRPIDLISGSSTAVDPHGHGTHVAGTIAALTGNGGGIAALAPGSQVLPVRALDATGSGYDSTVAEGIVRAVDAGAHVVNLSLGGPERSRVLSAAVDYAVQRGVVVVAAAGNSGPSGPVEYPAALPGVLAVGATTSTDAIASFSTHGPHVDLVAPGAGIWSTWPQSQLARKSGTSMAAPFVSAAAALLLSTRTAPVDRAAVPGLLVRTADDLGPTGRDDAYGAGLLDVVGARQAQGTPTGSTGTTAPAPAPVSAPAPAPVSEPAPVAEPVAAPTAEPTAAPVVEPTAAPVVEPTAAPVVEPTAGPTAAPSAAPTAAPVPSALPTAAPEPVATVLGARLSAGPRTVLPRQPVAVGVRALADGRHGADLPVRLQRRTAHGGWATLRTGTSGPDGLVTWVLRPDTSLVLRAVVGGGPTAGISPLVPVAVRPVVRALPAARYVTAVVQPSTRTRVVLQRWTGRAWSGVTAATTDRSGVVRLAPALPSGTAVRLVVPAAATRPSAVSSVVRWRS